MKKETIKQNPRVLLVGARARLMSVQSQYKELIRKYNKTWFFDDNGKFTTVAPRYNELLSEINEKARDMKNCIEEVRRLAKELEDEN